MSSKNMLNVFKRLKKSAFDDALTLNKVDGEPCFFFIKSLSKETALKWRQVDPAWARARAAPTQNQTR